MDTHGTPELFLSQKCLQKALCKRPGLYVYKFHVSHEHWPVGMKQLLGSLTAVHVYMHGLYHFDFFYLCAYVHVHVCMYIAYIYLIYLSRHRAKAGLQKGRGRDFSPNTLYCSRGLQCLDSNILDLIS